MSTVSGFKERYPAFSGAPDATVMIFLGEAVADTAEWPVDYKQRAAYLLTAHKMTLEGLGVTSAIPAGLTSFKSGTFSVSVSDAASTRVGFDATVYGREFSALRSSLFSGMLMAWGHISA